MPRISWDDLNAGASQYGGFVGNAIKAVKGGACALYRQSPGWAIGGIFPNPAVSFLRGVWDSLCGDDPGGLPPPPSAPFVGGQCECVPYQIYYRTYAANGTPLGDEYFIYKLGKVTAPVAQSLPNGSTNWLITYPIDCSGGQPTGFETSVVNITDTASGQSVAVSRVVRTDGLPDNCGSPPPSYPPPTYRRPPDPPPAIVDYNDGTDIAIPLIYFPINLNGEINVDVGGVTFKFDAGGVEFNFNFDKDTGENKYIPPPTNDDLGNDLGDIRHRLDELRDDIADVKDDLGDQIKKPKPPDQLDKEDKAEDDDKEEDKPNLQYVCITLTQRPRKNTIQYGDGSPDWMAAGWFEWKLKSGGYLPRQPIHFDGSCYNVPVGIPVVGYAYTLTNGARGYATTYSVPIE